MRVTNVYAGNDCIVVEFDGSREITLSNNATNREFMREFQDSCYYQAKLHFTELVNRVANTGGKNYWFKQPTTAYYVDVEVLARLYEDYNMSLAYKYDHKLTEENREIEDKSDTCYKSCYFEDLRGNYIDDKGYEHSLEVRTSCAEARNLEQFSEVYLELEKLIEGV